MCIFQPMPPKRREPRVPTQVVRLEAFDVHGHHGKSAFDYTKFFRFIANIDPILRRETVAGRVIAVPIMNEEDGMFTFVAYEGQPGAPFLMFDLESDSEEVGSVPRGKLLASRTIGIINPTSRRAVVQFVFAGVRAPQISTLFEKLAQANGSDFVGSSLEFAIRPGETFRQELAALELIKSAELRLTKPNYEWTDYPDALSNLAGDSGSQSIEVSVSAPRNEGLSKSKGIVRVIRGLVSGENRSILKSASVKGIKQGEAVVTEVNLKRHNQAKTVAVPKSTDGLPSVPALVEESKTFLQDSGN
jgi:hypothetical protein